MNVKTLTRSFAGGVVTPEMFGRLDLVKYQTGLAEAVNFVTLPHGPAANRNGFEWMKEVKDSTKLTVILPFIYSTTQSYVLEFGDLYVRFYTNAGSVLEANTVITGITQANPGVVTDVAHGYANGQWVFLASIGGMTQLNNRYVKVAGVTANTFQLTDTAGNNIDTTAYTAYTAGGTAARVYEIVSPYAVGDLLSLHFTQSADVLTITHPTYQQRELRRSGATSWAFTALGFAPTLAAPAAPTLAATGAGAINYTYVTTALAANTLEETLASASATVANDITIAGQYNSVTTAAVGGAIRYNIYKLIGGLYGFIGQTDGSALLDKNITPDTTKTPPLTYNPMASADNYPAAVGYWQGRRWFAGTNTQPQTAWATRSGTESNMSYSIPTRASDSISFRIAARQANAIRHIVPANGLLFLTSGGEWLIQSADGTRTITPDNVDPNPQEAIGANNVQPLVVGGVVLYAQDRGSRIREIEFSWQSQNYKSVDISIMAPHYFDGYTITSMAFQRGPNPIAWFTRSDGALIGLTYVKEHQVSAWHIHNTGYSGTFESVCVVPEGNEDVLYATVRRVINGRIVRSVERQRSRLMPTLASAFFVDAGVTYNGSAATVISGLWHLVGATVSILADGAVVAPQVVSAAGTITLAKAASIVTIGCLIAAKFKTLPISLETQALGQGTEKNVNKVYLRVNSSSGISAGPSYDTVRQLKQRTTEPYDSPPSLVTDERSEVITPSWNTNGQICVVQNDPLPITVLSMTVDVALGN